MLVELGQVSFYLSKPGVNMDDLLDSEKLPKEEGELFKKRDFKFRGINIRFYCLSSESFSGNPPWLDFVNQKLGKDSIHFESHSKRTSGLLLFEMEENIIAATFGVKGSSFLDKKKLIPDFGIKTAMNMCGNTELRQTKSSTHSANTKSIDRQLSKPSDSFYFGLDESELLKFISANLSENVTLQGKQSLTIKLIKEDKVCWDKLISYAIKFVKEYKEDRYEELFPNFPNFKDVPDLVESKLNDKLELCLKNRDFSLIHMAIPEFIANDEYSFSYTNKSKQENLIYSHIDINHLGRECRLSKFDAEYLSRKKVYAYSHVEESVLSYKYWSVFDCIVAEFELDNKYYVLNEGLWKQVSQDFYESLNEFIKEKVNVYDIDSCYHDICIYDDVKKQNREEVFNSKYCSMNEKAIKFDQAKLKIGKGRSDKEFCDIFQINKDVAEIIHVKKDGGSHSLSYLFSQARFYCEFFLSDKNFISDIRKYILDYEEIDDDFKEFCLDYIKDEPADVIGRDYSVNLWILYGNKKDKPDLDTLPLMTKFELKLAYDKLRNVYKYRNVLLSFVPVNIVNNVSSSPNKAEKGR